MQRLLTAPFRVLAHLPGRWARWRQRPRVIFKNRGHCPTCDRDVLFQSTNGWFRDHYLCPSCRSKPRERALMRTLEMFFPDWRERVIHESSPINRGASVRLAKECRAYIPSQLFPDLAPGEIREGVRCEDLGAMTFADASIDLHVTQDVLEHVLDPAAVFREIARTLKPGGAHVCTVPLVNKHKPSAVRARPAPGGGIDYLMEPAYHGNPVSQDGALVTVDWGYDIGRHIFEACGLYSQIVYIDDISRGIRAEYIEVLVTFKPAGEPPQAPAP